MPRYSTKELLVSTTLIACGLAILAFMLRGAPYIDPETSTVILTLSAWCVGGALIGAGLFVPFHRPHVGAFLGLVVQLVLMIVSFVLSAVFYFHRIN
jgi:hypothetical protein